MQTRLLKQISIMVLAVMALTLSNNLYGQRGGGRQMRPADERAKEQTTVMQEKLGLDSLLSKTAFDINLRYAKMNDSLLQSMEGGDRRAAFTEMQQQRDEKDKEFKKILSKDQYKKYLKLQEEQNAQMRPQGGQRPGGQRPPGNAQGRPSR